MINPTELYNQILGNILSRVPGGFAMHDQIMNRRDVNAADAANAVASGGSNSAPVNSGAAPVPFSAIFDYFAQGGEVDNALLRKAIEAEIDAAAIRNNLDPNLVRAVVRAESNYRHDAVSSAGAMGLMQLMPGTAEWLGVTDPFDIRQNIDGGTRYLRHMLNLFDEDLTLALAAYNAGQGNVRRHGGVPPFAETQRYIPRVMGFMEEYAVRAYQRSAEDSRFN